MALRSGKKINHIGTTTFYRETTEMMKIIETYNKFINENGDQHHNRGITLRVYEFVKHPTVPDYISEIIKKQYCAYCSKLMMFNEYAWKWRETVKTEYSNCSFKNVFITKISDAVASLSKLEASGEYHLCGCSDPSRRDAEDAEWNMYLRAGKPGYSREIIVIDEDNESDEHRSVLEWIATPEITKEDYEEKMFSQCRSWRHDLAAMRDDFESHGIYLQDIQDS